MKRGNFLIVVLLLILFEKAYAQNDKIFFGPSISFNAEPFTQVYYENGRQERNAESQFFGFGIRIHKKLNRIWGIILGINQLTTEHKTNIPFNHCKFIKPGEACTYELRYVNSYGYKTLQLEFGIMHYLINRSKVEMYLKLSASTALDYESFYKQSSDHQTMKDTKDHWFSNSLLGSVGLGFRPTSSTQLVLEPFLISIQLQRKDPIIRNNKITWSYFDHYGACLSFMIQL